MRYGEIKLKDLSEKEKDEILESIIDDCVDHAGDSYSDFARPVISLLNRKKLVGYGDATEN